MSKLRYNDGKGFMVEHLASPRLLLSARHYEWKAIFLISTMGIDTMD